MNTNKKVQPESKYTPSGVTEQLPPAPKYMGGSGAFGLVGGANIVSAGKQILKSGIGRGAINLVKSIFKKKAPKTVFRSKPVDFMGPNPANKIGAGGNSYPR